MMRYTLALLLLPPQNAFHINSIQKTHTNNLKRVRTSLYADVVATRIPVGTDFVSLDHESIYDTEINKEHDWIKNLDYESFRAEVASLGKELQLSTGQEDVDHLEKVLRWRDIAVVLGVGTMWAPLNPITVLALSTWIYASWTMVAHHTCHGGYNRVDAGKYNSRGFALGNAVRRIVDWGDWMLPEAWNVEHNRLHHYHTNEDLDPDLVENNLDFLREMDIPMPLKYLSIAIFIPTWKWFYYAPNTFKELVLSQYNKDGNKLPENLDPSKGYTIKNMFFPDCPSDEAMQKIISPLAFFKQVLLPFLATRFILLPAPLLLIPGSGLILFQHAVLNLFAAELLTNTHAFVTIVTNHAGEDLYKYDDQVKPRSGSFYVRNIVGAANFAAGTDLVDFSHGWLNYQIEHHVWPDLSMLQYQRGAPKLKAICKKHGVPYIQESVWIRVRKTVDIMVGKTNMKRFPTHYEPKKDKTSIVTWRSTNGPIES